MTELENALLDVLERIHRRALFHPDDTPEDMKRNLYHVECMAANELRANGREARPLQTA